MNEQDVLGGGGGIQIRVCEETYKGVLLTASVMAFRNAPAVFIMLSMFLLRSCPAGSF